MYYVIAHFEFYVLFKYQVLNSLKHSVATVHLQLEFPIFYKRRIFVMEITLLSNGVYRAKLLYKRPHDHMYLNMPVLHRLSFKVSIGFICFGMNK